MINDTYLADKFSEVLTEENQAERLLHEPSGKLSASMLGDPLQWQILKTIGVPQKEVDTYTLGVFLRGKSVEDLLLDKLSKKVQIVEQQKKIEYRGTVGLVDAVIDTSEMNFKDGILPFEVKSVKNSKYKRLETAKEADPQHRLQATLYALAMGTNHYGIVYVAADDLRIMTWIYDTADTKDEVEAIIDNYERALKLKTLPMFEARYKWQENPDYCKYPDFMDKDEEYLKEFYPMAYGKLKQH